MPATGKKILADLWHNKTRSLLVALSIAVGVFAVGVVASAFALVQKDMAADYAVANAHTARIYTGEFDDGLLSGLRDVPGVTAVDGRYNLWVNISDAGGKLYPINLNSIGPLADIQVDQLIFEAGSATLAAGEIYLERQGATGLGVGPGDAVTLTLNDGQTRQLRVAGTVHDVTANPFAFTDQTSGYVTPETMAELGGSALYNFVSLITAGSPTDAAQVREVADRVAAEIEAAGYTVYNVNVTNPGQHPAQAIIDTVLLLMGALSVLAVFLSAFLVTNTITALLGQQVRQIGVMKALGATMGQVMGIYLGVVLGFGGLALLIAMPLAALAAYGLSRWLVTMLNATPSAFAIPPLSLALQLLIGLAVPLLAALVPVVGGARRTVREAMTTYGLSASSKSGMLDRLVDALPWLPRPLLLSLRNTFRRKGRLGLTLATLTLGGAIFIAMLGVRESLYWEINESFGAYQSDVNVELAQRYPLVAVEAALADVSGVTAVEGWRTTNANVPHADDTASDQIVVYAPPMDTALRSVTLLDGRWLQPTDAQAIVVDNHFADLRPDVGVGDVVRLRLNDRETAVTIVGVFRLASNVPNPITYVTADVLVELEGGAGEVNSLRLITDRHDLARQEEALAAAQTRLSEQGYAATLTTGGQIIAQQRSRIDILITLLLLMGLLIALVGGLGLMGTMGMNVLERTREIGVLRAVGATHGAVFQMVIVEGALIGLISWALSAIVAVPITQFLDNRLGEQLLTIPIVYIFSLNGLGLWLVGALLLATIASLLPARSAVRLTVRDTLAYE